MTKVYSSSSFLTDQFICKHSVKQEFLFYRFKYLQQIFIHQTLYFYWHVEKIRYVYLQN